MSETVNNSRNSGMSAISSWSGYMYQGKIAIFHVLKLLMTLNDVSNYELRLDCEEDFDILKNDAIVSLHQVKGKGSKYFSGYETAFEDIRTKNNISEKLFFHLSHKIINKTIVDIENDYSPVKVYKYSEDKYYCTLDEIDPLLKLLIKDYLVKNNSEAYRQLDSYIDQIKQKLDDLVISKILEIHSRNMKKEGKVYDLAKIYTIPFSEFSEIILSQNIENWVNSEEYIVSISKYNFNKYLYEYLNLFTTHIDTESEVRLRKYIVYISEYSIDKMKIFYSLLIPHRKVCFDRLKDFISNSIQSDDFKYAFFKILGEINRDLYMDKEYLYWLNEMNVYSPTAINKSGENQMIETCMEIYNNIIDNDLEVGYECQNLITTELDVDSIVSIVNNINHIENDEVSHYNEKDQDRLSRWKNVSLVSLNKAKDILNDE